MGVCVCEGGGGWVCVKEYGYVWGDGCGGWVVCVMRWWVFVGD